MRRGAWFGAVAVLCVGLLVWEGQRRAEASVVPIGAAVTRIGSSAIVWIMTSGAEAGAVAAEATVASGASAWGTATVAASALGTIAGWGVLALAAGGATYGAYRGWKAFTGWWNGKPTGVAGEDIKPGSAVPGGNPDKLYVHWVVTGLPEAPLVIAAWSSKVVRLHSYATEAQAMAAYTAAGGDQNAAGQYYAWTYWQTDGVTDFDQRHNWLGYVKSSGSNPQCKSVWAWPVTAGPAQDVYREATAADLQKAITDGVKSADGQAREQLQGIMTDLATALASHQTALNGNTQALQAMTAQIAASFPQSWWDNLTNVPPPDPSQLQPSGIMEVDLVGVGQSAAGQLVDIVKTGVAAGSPKPMTQAEATQAHKDALEEDRLLRPNPLTYLQTVQAHEEALTANRAAEEAAASQGSVPGAPVFDPQVTPPQEQDLGGLLGSIKSRLLALPFLSYVTGAHISAAGNPVVSCQVYGRTVTMDFSKYEGVWDSCGAFLLVATAIIWGRKMIGVE